MEIAIVGMKLYIRSKNSQRLDGNSTIEIQSMCKKLLDVFVYCIPLKHIASCKEVIGNL